MTLDVVYDEAGNVELTDVEAAANAALTGEITFAQYAELVRPEVALGMCQALHAARSKIGYFGVTVGGAPDV